MNSYTLTLIVNKSLSEDKTKSLLETITKNFKKLVKEDLWGKRNLSYPIKHQTEAYYAHYEFEAEPEAIRTIDKTIRTTEDIIRSLMIRK